MLLKMEKDVNACVIVILIGVAVKFGALRMKGSQERACARSKLW
jgi:hypothetical protein